MDPLILLFPMINPPKWQRHEGDYLLMVIILVSMVSMKLIWKSTFLLLILIQMISLLGYVPFNPHKVNQDWMLIREDKVTGTLVLGVFDGHGEHGQCVSEVGSKC